MIPLKDKGTPKKYKSLSSIVRTFIIIFTLLTIISISIFDIIYIRFSYNNEIQHADQTLAESKRLFDGRISDMITAMQNVIYSGGGNQFCFANRTWRNENQYNIKAQLSQFGGNSTYTEGSIIYSFDGAYCTSSDFHDNPLMIINQINQHQAITNPFRQPYLYVSAGASTKDKAAMYVILPIWQSIDDKKYFFNYCGIAAIQINAEKFLTQINVTSHPLILKDADSFVASSSREIHNLEIYNIANTNTPSIKIDGSSLILYHDYIDWKIQPETQTVLTLSIIMAVLMVGIHAVFVLLFQRQYVQPINHLAHQIANTSNNTFEILPEMQQRDELTMLTQGFNHMLSRIEKSNQEEANRLRERALFVQSRINPHFLYNNLECICGMVSLGYYDQIKEMAGLLAEIYRFCNHSAPCVTLDEEIVCADNYVKILALRYPGRITFKYDFKCEAGEYYLPRMTLQPLIENSILHGMDVKSEHMVSIHLAVFDENEQVRIELTDDGLGTDDETLRNMNSLDYDNDHAIKHLGIQNVRCRLSLLFGPSSSLQFEHGSSSGIKAIIVLPKKTYN